MNDKEIIKLREKILKGIALSFDKLVQEKIKTDGEFVFSIDGENIIIKAKDLKK